LTIAAYGGVQLPYLPCIDRLEELRLLALVLFSGRRAVPFVYIAVPNSDQDAVKKQIPLNICPACGSTWFREITIDMYSCAKELISKVHMQVLVCLCGTPFEPNIGGVPPSPTAEYELWAFWQSFAKAEAIIQKCHNRELVAKWAAAKLMREERLEKLAQKALPLEREIGRQLSRADPQRKSLRGRHWEMPTRTPAGFRDELTAALQAHGFTFRQARQTVKAFFEAIKGALLRGEEVETSFGTLRTEDSPDRQTRWRPIPNRPGLLRVQVLFRNPTRIVLRDQGRVGACKNKKTP
jgi:Bacterial DNA-binding protein